MLFRSREGLGQFAQVAKALLGIGMLVLWILPVAVLVWYLYRVIKGWLRLNDLKPIE